MYQEKSPVSSLHISVVSYSKIVYGNILCSRRTHGKLFVFLQNFISVSLLVTILTVQYLLSNSMINTGLTNVKKTHCDADFFTSLKYLFFLLNSMKKFPKPPSE